MDFWLGARDESINQSSLVNEMLSESELFRTMEIKCSLLEAKLHDTGLGMGLLSLTFLTAALWEGKTQRLK